MARIIIQAEDGVHFGTTVIAAQHGWGSRMEEYLPAILSQVEAAVNHDSFNAGQLGELQVVDAAKVVQGAVGLPAVTEADPGPLGSTATLQAQLAADLKAPFADVVGGVVEAGGPEALPPKYLPQANIDFVPQSAQSANPWNSGWPDPLWCLTPAELDKVPDGAVLVCIDGSTRTKGTDYIDTDTRGGYIGYGFTTVQLNGGTPLVKEADPELERLLAEEEEIERNQRQQGIIGTPSPGLDALWAKRAGRYTGEDGPH